MQIFSKEEIKDLIVAVALLILIFSFKPFPDPGINYNMLPYIVIVVIISFLPHTLAHKFVARKFGCMAIYKMWPNGIFFALVLMLIGIPFAAPAVMMIYPYFFGRWGYKVKTLTTNENGIIGLSGPAVNLLFAIFFSLFNGFNTPGFLGTLIFVNTWIAFINLLPIKPLAGSKILEWRIWVWGLMLAIAFLLVILSIGLSPL